MRLPIERRRPARLVRDYDGTVPPSTLIRTPSPHQPGKRLKNRSMPACTGEAGACRGRRREGWCGRSGAGDVCTARDGVATCWVRYERVAPHDPTRSHGLESQVHRPLPIPASRWSAPARAPGTAGFHIGCAAPAAPGLVSGHIWSGKGVIRAI